MGKASKWLRSFLTGKKEKEKEKGCNNQFCSISIDKPMTPMINPPNTPREKKRWSFRRLSATKDTNSMDSIPTNSPSVMQAMLESENEQKKHAMAMTTAADAVIRLASSATTRSSVIEEAAAIKIQSLFRSYLARKALCALRGLVKLQALVRGHLVRKQATTTLRCMQALVTVQARARTQRIRKAEETKSIHRKSTQDNRFRQAYNMDRGVEENVKIVEMDLGDLRGNSKGRYSYSTHTQVERADHRFSTHSTGHHAHSKQEHQYQMSPAQSALTDTSPRAYSGHFEDYYFGIRQSSPQYHLGVSRPDSTKVPFTSPKPEYEDSISHEYPFFPNYMANTESFKAKARSQSAPKQRPDAYERQPSRRKASIEAKIVPRVVRMQRSSSHVGSTAHGYKNPWSIKLDRSSVSLKDSECGSSSTVLTNNNYCRSLLAYEMSTY